MIFRVWLYVFPRIIYTIENNMSPATRTNLIINESNVVFLKAPSLDHCSFLCISMIYLQCRGTVSHFFADDATCYQQDAMRMKCVTNWMLTHLRVREWLHCNELSFIVIKKPHYIILTPRNKIVDVIKTIRVYVTKLLGVQIESQLSWKIYINYIC